MYYGAQDPYAAMRRSGDDRHPVLYYEARLHENGLQRVISAKDVIK